MRLTAVTGESSPSRAVLVVDGDGSSMSTWAAALAELGVPVGTARDASGARASRHAVVVIGTLPDGQSAIALARELGARPADERPRIVLVSREEVRRADRVHVDATLPRPVRTEVLVAHVRRLLALSERTAPRARRSRSE